MKTSLLLAVLLLCSMLPLRSQDIIEVVTNPPCKDPGYINGKPIFDIVEVMPSFPGGEDSLVAFIAKNFHKPQNLDPSNKHIYLRIIVDEQGNCLYPCILNPNNFKNTGDLQQAVVDFMAVMPRWEPGLQRNTAVNVRYSFPIKPE